MKPFRYRIVVEWSDEDQAYVGRVPALPGCAAHGATLREVTSETLEAAEGILESMLAHGDSLPHEDRDGVSHAGPVFET